MTMTIETETTNGITRSPRERDNARTLFVGKHRRPVLHISATPNTPRCGG